MQRRVHPNGQRKGETNDNESKLRIVEYEIQHDCKLEVTINPPMERELLRTKAKVLIILHTLYIGYSKHCIIYLI
jgi:hypothetical protein